MAAARCTICSLNFPGSQAGKLCPVCEASKLDSIQNDDPDDPAELNKAVSYAKFERLHGPAEVT